jgi:hypothetical protein
MQTVTAGQAYFDCGEHGQFHKEPVTKLNSLILQDEVDDSRTYVSSSGVIETYFFNSCLLFEQHAELCRIGAAKGR